MRSVQAAISLAALIAASGCGSSGTAHTSRSSTSTSVPALSAASAVMPPKASASTIAATAVPSASSPAPRLTGRIVFRRYGDADHTSASLFVINADGTHERSLTRLRANVLDYESNWSPDGKVVIFTRSTGSSTGADEAHQLVTVAVSGGKETAVTPRRPAIGAMVPGWDEGADFSPDGGHIAYVHSWGTRDPLQHSDIFIADANGKHARRVTRFADGAGTSSGPRWAPDGKQLVFTRYTTDPSQPVSGQALYLVNTDGTHLHRLTPWSAMAGGDPDWSKTTNLIAFRSAPEESGIGDVSTIRPDGSGLTQVTHLSNTSVSHTVGFSPDGRWLVFATGADGEFVNQLTVAAVDGSSVRTLTRSTLADSTADWTS